MIKNAGAMINAPFGSAVRSILVAIFELGVNEIMIIGHTDCGVQHIDSNSMIEHMIDRGIDKKLIDMIAMMQAKTTARGIYPSFTSLNAKYPNRISTIATIRVVIMEEMLVIAFLAKAAVELLGLFIPCFSFLRRTG